MNMKSVIVSSIMLSASAAFAGGTLVHQLDDGAGAIAKAEAKHSDEMASAAFNPKNVPMPSGKLPSWAEPLIPSQRTANFNLPLGTKISASEYFDLALKKMADTGVLGEAAKQGKNVDELLKETFSNRLMVLNQIPCGEVQRSCADYLQLDVDIKLPEKKIETSIGKLSADERKQYDDLAENQIEDAKARGVLDEVDDAKLPPNFKKPRVRPNAEETDITSFLMNCNKK